jgi:hypothetical protein
MLAVTEAVLIMADPKRIIHDRQATDETRSRRMRPKLIHRMPMVPCVKRRYEVITMPTLCLICHSKNCGYSHW